AVAFGSGWAVNGWRMDAKLARQESAHTTVLEQMAQATVAAVEAVRTEEARRTAAVEKERELAKREAQALQGDVAAAADAAGRLQRELDAIRRRGWACNPATADGGKSQPSADPIGVLIDVLTGMESAGREVAEYADRMRI